MQTRKKIELSDQVIIIKGFGLNNSTENLQVNRQNQKPKQPRSLCQHHHFQLFCSPSYSGSPKIPAAYPYCINKIKTQDQSKKIK